MHRLLSIVAVCLLALGNTGCIVNMWSSDPKTRTDQLLVWSENLRMIEEEWNRFWFSDQPSHLSPVRTHGGAGY